MSVEDRRVVTRWDIGALAVGAPTEAIGLLVALMVLLPETVAALAAVQVKPEIEHVPVFTQFAAVVHALPVTLHVP